MTKTDDPAYKVGRDLTQIRTLMDLLRAQAVAAGNIDDKDNDLGYCVPDHYEDGLPVLAVGPVSSPAAWQRRYDYNVAWNADHPDRPRDLRYIDVEHAVEEPPLQMLLRWSEPYRKAHGTELGLRRPTLGTEAAFLTWCLPTIRAQHAEDWERFADDINTARVRLEDFLHAGTRKERTRVLCNHCTKAPRLIRIRTADVTGDSDFYKCPECRHRYDETAFKSAYAHQLRHDGAARFVDQGDAVATLAAQGRPARTVRKWISPLTPRDQCQECGETWAHQEHAACPKRTAGGTECGGLLDTVWVGDREALIEGYCEIGTRRRFVWWPDLWRKHLATPTRKRRGA